MAKKVYVESSAWDDFKMAILKWTTYFSLAGIVVLFLTYYR